MLLFSLVLVYVDKLVLQFTVALLLDVRQDYLFLLLAVAVAVPEELRADITWYVFLAFTAVGLAEFF